MMEVPTSTVSSKHARLDELIDELADARRSLLQAVHEAPEVQHRETRRDDGWTLAQILEHLSIVESGAGRMINRLVKEAREKAVAESKSESVLGALDHLSLSIPREPRSAPDFTMPVEGISVGEAIDRLTTNRARLLQVLDGVRGIALDTVSAPHPAVGMLDGYGWILLTAQHERRHTYQIRQLSNQERA